MLVAILGGPMLGIDAMLLYLLTYGVANLATFGALAAIERNGHEVDSLEDLAGLRTRAPKVALALAIGALSLTGIPPLVGFWGKLGVMMTSIKAHQVALLVILAVNSAIAAFYYLRLVATPFVVPATPRTQAVAPVASIWPRVSALCFAVGCLLLPAFVGPLHAESVAAAKYALPGSPKVATISPLPNGSPSGDTRP
jgi:NADH-quinone oxidoreductase subunit N